MTTLADITLEIFEKLEQEAGNQTWWTSSEIKTWYNEIYIDICREGGFKRTRDVTTDSVEDQVAYSVPDDTITILGMTYDGKHIHPTTLAELNTHDKNWRSRGSGEPYWYYYEDGGRYIEISLFPKPDADGVEIGFNVELLPTALEDVQEPIRPFRDGLIIRDAVMSLALAKEGEGQNIERSEWYWGMFVSKLALVTQKPKLPERVHALRSIEDGGRSGLNLGDHYEPYVFR